MGTSGEPKQRTCKRSLYGMRSLSTSPTSGEPKQRLETPFDLLEDHPFNISHIGRAEATLKVRLVRPKELENFQHLPHRESRSNYQYIAPKMVELYSFNISHIGRAEATEVSILPSHSSHSSFNISHIGRAEATLPVQTFIYKCFQLGFCQRSKMFS